MDPPPGGGYPNQTTALGEDALFHYVGGRANVAVGYQALYNSTTGFQNQAIGSQALYNNTIGSWNAAIGFQALYKNTIGSSNTAIAPTALYSNTTGSYNCGIGYGALGGNTDGSHNIATGQWALYRNTSGISNVATGFQALFSNTTGQLNTAAGNWALLNNTGDNNTAVGVGALYYNETGNNNIALGLGAGYYSTGDNNIDIGNAGVSDDSNTIRIGSQGTQTATYIAGILDATASGGTPVFISADGQLGTKSSSERFKRAIKPMEKVSEAILALKPVTFEYKNDNNGIPQFGLVAEEVAKVNPDLVMRDRNGDIFTVRYDAVNAMLLNEFLKEHRKVEELQEQVAALTAGLQKVSAQLETMRPAPQVVVTQ